MGQEGQVADDHQAVGVIHGLPVGDGIVLWRQARLFTDPFALASVKQAMDEQGFSAANEEISMLPSTTVPLEGSDAEAMLGMIDALEDLDDVQHVYCNFDISDEEMARLV